MTEDEYILVSNLARLRMITTIMRHVTEDSDEFNEAFKTLVELELKLEKQVELNDDDE